MSKYNTAKPYIASYMIVRRGNKIVFVKRSKTGWMDGYYGLPAGKVENDESYLEAAVRETKEEIGIDITTDQLKQLITIHRKTPESYWVDIYFEVLQWSGEPVNGEPKSHSEIAWLDLNNLPDKVIPAVRFTLEQIEAGKTYAEYGWKG